jgi:hypothetical protein
MAEYRVPDFTLEQRINAALEMIVPWPQREWGRVTKLAWQHGVSRTRLYELRDCALQALVEALGPRDAGRPGQITTLTVDKRLIDRAIVVLPMLTGTVRGIQHGLELILKVRRSVGYISQTLTAAGEQATAYNLRITLPLPILGEADEIFQGRRPCLTVVDGRSFLVVNLTPAESRDGTTWGVTFLDLAARGIQFQDLASDGGTGLLSGVHQAQLAIPLRPDLFHLLRDAHRLTQRLDRAAYQAIETAERARRAEREAQSLQRRRGPRLKIRVPVPQAEIEEAQAIATDDLWGWLSGEIRQALDPITPDGHLAPVSEVRATLETALELLKELPHPEITAFANALQDKIPALIAPLEWLEQHLASVRQGLDETTAALVIWAWQHRQELNVNIAADFPAALQPVVRAFWDALSLFHRSSSLAESLHSWLRPHLQIHRGMPKWLLPLLQLFWNHHKFERGKRVGSSPLALAGVTDAPSLKEVLDQLFRPSLSARLV